MDDATTARDVSDCQAAAQHEAERQYPYGLGLIGFGEFELGKLLPDASGDVDPDDAPEPPAEPISRPGDIWICGEHRVLCGDAMVRSDVDKVLDGDFVDMAFADPPSP